MMNSTKVSLLTCAAVASVGLSSGVQAAGVDADQIHISPVTNPLFFEDPHINSEVRPIFAYHNIDESFVTQGGIARVFAAQVRWAITDRLALIATKDGFISLHPSKAVPHNDGWADIGAGLKYAVIDDKENNLIVTPGFKFELPTGNQRVFQGNGRGEWDLFVSAAKGYDRLNLTGSVGARIPNDFSQETAQLHYSAQVDYVTCQYFIPFVALNAYTTLNNGRGLGLTHEGYDLINFGASNAAGTTDVTGGIGFRSRLLSWVDLGVAYERGLTHPQGLFEDRYTFDMIFRF